jgi:2-iminoacetate synthase ThiH
MLGFLKLMPSVQVMGKVMMMEALSQADVLMQNMPGADKTMEVILKDRNQVVIDDLAAIIAKEPGVKDVGIIYGGAHMPDLEERLQKMGYQEMAVDWIDAITVDLPKKASERAQLESMRKTIRRSLEQQLKQLQKAAETRKAKAS